jgi:hypothetical protein
VPAPELGPVPRATATSMVAPMPTPESVVLRRSRLPIVLLALLALGGIGAAGYLYFLQWRAKQAAETAPPAVAMPVTTVDAAAAQPPPPAIDAAAAAVALPADAAEPERAPVDAAIVTTTRPDTQPPPLPPKDPKDPKKDPLKTAGPPGFITIDSSPMYSVIFIDGKRLGETPLVRIPLAPGTHAVRAVSPSGTSRTMTIVIEPGKVAPTRRIEW